MTSRVLLIAVALLFTATGANAQLVVGSDFANPAIIYHIDVGTGAATPLYNGGAEAEAWGMAYDPAQNILYWNNGSELYSSLFSMGGLTPALLGTMTYNGANVNFVGLAFRGGKLLGTRNITTEAVYEIDPVTLEATLIYQYPASDYDFGGLAVDLVTGGLYGLSDDATPARGLYEIDTIGQTVTFRAPYPAGETDIDGLAADNGVAYYVTDEPGLFYIYDIASGMQVGTLESPFTGSAIFSAATYVQGGSVSIEDSSWGQIKGLYR